VDVFVGAFSNAFNKGFTEVNTYASVQPLANLS
jgi:hypothetical protein